jgi:hypothetical protein
MKDRYDQKTFELPGMEDTPAPAPAPDTPTRRGRPPVHANAAAKQKAYRERLKSRGMREVRRVVRDCRDEASPLRSDIIDLSEVRGAGGARRIP